jgi:dTDP-6-deoxy-L-talose 4-dehydrogenase (NAD+)
MLILLTGGTGLLGKSFLSQITKLSCSVLNITRTGKVSKSSSVLADVHEILYDINSNELRTLDELPAPDCVIHFAWGGLSDFQSSRHLEIEFPTHKSFLEYWIMRGVKRIIVIGTCFEYGLVEGEISENISCKPVTLYGIAKNSLHVSLRDFINGGGYGTQLVWLRVFYVKSEHRGIFGALSSAIQEGSRKFQMSGGHQIRDYLTPRQIAEKIEIIMQAPNPSEIYNICSGEPRKLIDLVEEFRLEKSSDIEFELGIFGYLDYEPMEFWGSTRKFDALYSKKGRSDI